MQAYAMTEASHQMTSNPLPKHGPHKPGLLLPFPLMGSFCPAAHGSQPALAQNVL